MEGKVIVECQYQSSFSYLKKYYLVLSFYNKIAYVDDGGFKELDVLESLSSRTNYL